MSSYPSTNLNDAHNYHPSRNLQKLIVNRLSLLQSQALYTFLYTIRICSRLIYVINPKATNKFDPTVSNTNDCYCTSHHYTPNMMDPYEEAP